MSSFMEQYFGTTGDAKRKLFDAMQECGVAYLEARYSGGNDEGGVDEIETLKDSRGETVTIDNIGWEHPLWEAVDGVLATEFGTWAGDFSAYGTLTADLKTGKVSRAGEMSSYAGDSHEY